MRDEHRQEHQRDGLRPGRTGRQRLHRLRPGRPQRPRHQRRDAYVEVYSRGYTGSPCKDANGNYCFNRQALTRYGNSNKHVVPIGTQNLPIRLPMTCAHKGTAGAISGRTVNAAGKPVKVQAVYGWTETKWNAYPFYQGWGIAQLPRDGYYTLPALASRQTYVLWVKTLDGRTVKRTGVRVDDCRITALNIRV